MISTLILFGVVMFIIFASIRSLNPGLPKFGSGKKAKEGGDYVASRLKSEAKKATTSAAKVVGKAAWKQLKKPFT